jgi:general secretion pathway protein G
MMNEMKGGKTTVLPWYRERPASVVLPGKLLNTKVHVAVFTSVRGFTLIEVMVVVIILGILAAIIAPRLVGRTDDARVTQALVQIKNFETALKLFKMDNGFYPSTEQGLKALVEKPSTGRIPGNYRKGAYLEKKTVVPDPWGNEYEYISPGAESDYDIISFGADGEPGGEDYDRDITNWDE